jgi:amino acid adenylation domain-containing protein
MSLTANDLSQRLAKLSREEKAKLFERLHGKREGGDRIARRPAGSPPPPLSFAQQRLWFLDRLNPGDPAYNISHPVVIRGALDRAALARALESVAARHEPLRTVIGGTPAEPVQLISPEARIPLPRVDLTALRLPEPDRERPPGGELGRLVAEEASLPFDLRRGPLLRTALLQIGPACHVLLLTMHHIVSDGWSMGILVRETIAFYRARVADAAADLPELSIQYGDFAVWQRALLSGPLLAEHLAYWRGELSGAPEGIDLPLDRPRGAQPGGRGGRLVFELPPDLSERVRKLSLATGATPFVTLLSAYFAFLGRYGGQDELTVGTAIANRQRAQVEGLIGFFANTLVLRGRLAGDPSFRELSDRTRRGALGAFAHQDLPFEKLVEEMQPDRVAGRSPLFQAMFVLQNTPIDPLPPSVLDIGPLVKADESLTRFELTLALEERGERFRGVFSWNAAVFDRATIGRMAEHFVRLLGGAVERPDLPLSRLALLSPAEIEQGLAAGRAAVRPVDRPFLHQRVLDQAHATPEAPAVIFVSPEGETAWSYRQLAARVEAWAAVLARHGVGPERVVGLALDRSLELIAGMLAIWRAGGVYLPLDPSYPADRLAYTLEDSGASLVLTSQREAPALPPTVQVLAVEDLPVEAEERAPEPRLDGGHLAYMIYTSGSTGRPKGVEVSHASFANLGAAAAAAGAGPGSRMLLFFSPSFDASLLDIALPLVAGGALVLAPRGSLLPGRELAELLAAARITHAKLPPSALAAVPYGDFPDLRDLGVGGETCPPDLAARWGEGRRFWNLYGPTEATVFATLADVSDGRVHLGETGAGAEVHVLGPDGALQPPGVAGEILIGGAGLARGYHGRPDLTAQRFVPHPFAAPGEVGARLYRTGDLGRRLADGTLEFLGRTDHQVKVRGYRIEPEEIEAVLARHPAVAQAVVVARRDAMGGAALAAFVVAADEEPETDDLRHFLREGLPEFMVPNSFTLVAALPRTANGKVDRAALAATAAIQSRERAPESLPATELERELAALWGELLGLERVGTEDNFFDLGGHSILLTHVQMRLTERFSWEIPLLSLFEHPTIKALAAFLENRDKGDETAPGGEDSRGRASRQRDGFELQRQRLLERRAK